MSINRKMVFICVPSRDLWKAEFGLSLNQLVGRCFVDHGRPTHGFAVFPYTIMESGSSIATMRNSLVRRALANDDTSHVLFVDDDQMFPADMLHTLLSRNVDIIGANVVRKEANPRTNARKLESNDCAWTTPSSAGIEEVDYVGTGVMLISRKALETVGEPQFFYDIKNNVGEDVNFCFSARKKGLKVYIDHDVSKKVKHVGHFYWGHEHTDAWIKESQNGH